MEVPETELREMVRAAIARQARGHGLPTDAVPIQIVHASHTRFQLSRGADSDGACVIEPSVRCNHCGYCLSFGH